jgi:hypothetical protein
MSRNTYNNNSYNNNNNNNSNNNNNDNTDSERNYSTNTSNTNSSDNSNSNSSNSNYSNNSNGFDVRIVKYFKYNSANGLDERKVTIFQDITKEDIVYYTLHNSVNIIINNVWNKMMEEYCRDELIELPCHIFNTHQEFQSFSESNIVSDDDLQIPYVINEFIKIYLPNELNY